MSGLLLTALVVSAAASRGRDFRAQFLLLAISVLWLLLMGTDMEGRVLIPVTSTMGLTAGDLAGLAGIAIAAWRIRALFRQRG